MTRPQATNAKDRGQPREPEHRPGTHSPLGPPEGTSPADAWIWVLGPPGPGFMPLSPWDFAKANSQLPLPPGLLSPLSHLCPEVPRAGRTHLSGPCLTFWCPPSRSFQAAVNVLFSHFTLGQRGSERSSALHGFREDTTQGTGQTPPTLSRAGSVPQQLACGASSLCRTKGLGGRQCVILSSLAAGLQVGQ